MGYVWVRLSKLRLVIYNSFKIYMYFHPTSQLLIALSTRITPATLPAVYIV